MYALARCWTWIGSLFVPLAVGWAVYLRGGLSDQPPAMGVLISRGYAGLVISLVAGCALIWVLALYIRAARRQGLRLLIPPNTTFEELDKRNPVISWATLAVAFFVLTAALVIFGVRYSQSVIHDWSKPLALAAGFWASRARAHELGCPSQPCFAMAQHIEASGPAAGVYEYVLLFTDGFLVLLSAVLLGGMWYLITGLRRPILPPIDL